MNSEINLSTKVNELQSYDPSLDDPMIYQMDAGRGWTFHDLTLEELSSPTGAKFLMHELNVKVRELKAVQQKLDELSVENRALLVENAQSQERAKLFLLEILGGGLVGYATNLLTPLNNTNPNLLSGVVWLVIGLFMVLIIRYSDLSDIWGRIFRKEKNNG